MTTRTVILGAGESGTGAAILAKHLRHSVFVSDFGKIKDKYTSELNQNNIEFESGTHTEEKILNADVVIVSPGIPPKAPIIQSIISKGIPMISEIEFAAKNTNAILIGITGTNGKTTTTMLTYHLLKKAGLKVGLAGNVGQSMARQVAQNDFTHYVIELSSFQLDLMFETRINYAVLLNITPDHLDRYATYDDYIKSKFRITQNQTEDDRFIYCSDSEDLMNYFSKTNLKAQCIPFSLNTQHNPGAWADDIAFHINLYQPKISFSMDLNQLTISGKHNTYNSMAASIVANSLLIRNEVIRESLMDFKNVEHRLEYVATVKGVDYINDSKATNVNSAWYALESMKKSVVWIAGGIDKGNDYDLLLPLVKDKVRILICLGKNNIALHQAFSKHVDMVVNTLSAKEAVQMANGLAKRDEVVLLSPACASFDLFESYEDRGRQFKYEVRNL
ncbi:MAG: UDP-N-acetylmuramoyl-L-alanine--D-glutamate ligase [Flavobacteriales bacterium]|nr:UDP-N-acetylmuramoyl-L-alanine--D-glutamate ligase [Flavobacteriales bacterium]